MQVLAEGLCGLLHPQLVYCSAYDVFLAGLALDFVRLNTLISEATVVLYLAVS
jgi:hypothetical protein